MEITPEQLLEELKNALVELHFLRRQVEELQRENATLRAAGTSPSLVDDRQTGD